MLYNCTKLRLHNYELFKTTGFIYENDLIVGAKILDNIASETFNIHVTKVINATGPWGDTIRKEDFQNSETRLKLTKGAHLVVPHLKFPINQSIYFDLPEVRMLFAITRGKTTYLGTTDTDFSDSLENPLVTK